MDIGTVSTATLTGGGATNKSWTHVNDGNALVAKVSLFGPTNPGSATATYNGVAMTRVIEKVYGDGLFYYYTAIFYLENPAIGSYSVWVGWSNTHYGGFAGVSLLNCAGYENAASNYSTGSYTPTVDVTSSGGSYVIDSVAVRSTSYDTLTPGAGQTQRESYRVTDGGGHYGLSACSTKPGAGTVTMSWTNLDPTAWVSCGISLKSAFSGSVIMF